MRVRLFHWNAAGSGALIQSLALAGHTVEYDEKLASQVSRSIRESPPDAIVIDLTRLPSQGREVATYLRGSKVTRTIPIVFLDGAPEKVEAIRALMPDAVFTSSANLAPALVEAVTNRPVNPVVPPQMMDRYGGRSAAQKLGIKSGMKVGVIDAPRNYEVVLGPLPESATFVENADEITPITLWFAERPDTLQSQLRMMAKRASRSKLWILWRKGQPRSTSAINERFLRESGLAVGLVDYKVCSVNETWSALAFAVRKDSKDGSRAAKGAKGIHRV